MISQLFIVNGLQGSSTISPVRTELMNDNRSVTTCKFR